MLEYIIFIPTHKSKYTFDIFWDIIVLSRLSRTEETIKIELSKNHDSTTNYHFLHFYIEMKLNHMLR